MILICDRNPERRRRLKQMFEMLHYDVKLSSVESEELSSFIKEKPNVLIASLREHEDDAIEIIKFVKFYSQKTSFCSDAGLLAAIVS